MTSPVEVSWAHERLGYAQHLPHRAREHADSDEIQLRDALQHPLGDPLLEDLALEVVAVDEQRRDERLEARHPDRVEDAGADPGHVDLPGLHVLERPGLVQWLTAAPVLLELDRERPAREPVDLLRPAASAGPAPPPIGLAIVSTRGSASSAPPALSLLEPLHAARAIVDAASTAATAHRMNRLVCIVVHLHLWVPSTLRPQCSVYIGALPRLPIDKAWGEPSSRARGNTVVQRNNELAAFRRGSGPTNRPPGRADPGAGPWSQLDPQSVFTQGCDAQTHGLGFRIASAAVDVCEREGLAVERPAGGDRVVLGDVGLDLVAEDGVAPDPRRRRSAREGSSSPASKIILYTPGTAASSSETPAFSQSAFVIRRQSAFVSGRLVGAVRDRRRRGRGLGGGAGRRLRRGCHLRLQVGDRVDRGSCFRVGPEFRVHGLEGAAKLCELALGGDGEGHVPTAELGAPPRRPRRAPPRAPPEPRRWPPRGARPAASG